MTAIDTLRLQWSAIDVTAEQYAPMRDFAAKVLGLTLAYEVEDFAVFRAPNGSLLEIYGPRAKSVEWRNGKDAVAFGFDTSDIADAEEKLTAGGAELVGDLHVEHGVGVEGSDYRWRLFRAPDDRLYAVAQSDGRGKSG